MKSAIFSALAIFATFATALPTTPAGAGAVENLAPRGQVKQVINSVVHVNIREDMPDTALGATDKPVVSRVNGKHNSQAFIRIDFPDGLVGSKCKLAFANPAQFSGTGEIQVFTIVDVNIATTTFNKRPSRDQFKGTFRVSGWGEAEVVDGSGLTFDCPARGAKAYEIVSVGDNNEVVWYAPRGGLRVDVL